MLLTLLFVCAAIALLIVRTLLCALFLKWGLRWAKFSPVPKRSVLTAAIGIVVLQLLLDIAYTCLIPDSASESTIGGLVLLVGSLIVVPLLVIRIRLKATLRQSFQAGLAAFLASMVMIAFVVFAMHPYFCEGFFVPTNAMAPTLVGKHCAGLCSECGRPNFCSPSQAQHGSAGPQWCICENFHVSRPLVGPKVVRPDDKFLVAKFLEPKRWDVVVFQYPSDPRILYVKRLVGLPGEKVYIKDGAVWVNGTRLVPPDHIREITYQARPADWPDAEVLWVSPGRPALLADDEYFVLGDFSEQSSDSRTWDRGAPGHSPYAVPKSHLRGVVTHTYWPLSRMRIHPRVDWY
jgi:signal peptidase I